MKHVAVIVLLAVAGIDTALACACCTNRGQRTDVVQMIDDRISAQLEMLSFRDTAKLASSEREGGIEGLDHPTENFAVSVAQAKDRITFALRDEKGRGGTLSMIDPQMVSIFEVDQHDTLDTGLGPPLYKEWRITTRVIGDGIFGNNVGPNRRITLILHGRGNSCTDVTSFGHWSLHVQGSGGTEPYAFHGELASGQ